MKDDSQIASNSRSLSRPRSKRMVHVDGLAAPQRYWAFAAVISTVTLATMDQTIANVALPTISGDFHATPTDSIAIVSAYQLAMVVLLLPLSALGEIYGYRRVYLAGIAVFTTASLACVLSNSIATLTIARILQGVGAAGISSTNTALIRYIFPQANLGRGVGFNSMAVAIASTIGPSFAGIVLSFASWQWLFLINLPLGAFAFAIGLRNLPESDHADRRFDILSALLTAIAFGTLITTIQSFSHNTSWSVRAVQIMRRSRRHRLGGFPATGFAGPVIAGGLAAQADLRALGWHVHLLLHRANAGFRLPAFLPRTQSWARRHDDRLAHYALAANRCRNTRFLRPSG